MKLRFIRLFVILSCVLVFLFCIASIFMKVEGMGQEGTILYKDFVTTYNSMNKGKTITTF